MATLAIIGASGAIGGATLDSILSYKLLGPKSIIACTSSKQGSETWTRLEARGVNVRHATFDNASTMQKALSGVKKLFLVSTPKIELDYNDAKEGTGREAHHYVAIDAARSVGVEHIYYTSLAFANPSKAGVMQAHVRTERYLASLKDLKVTVIREGLYNESWPLYLGYYDPKADEREQVVIGGDGKISWTAIPDLGLATALVVTASGNKYENQTFYLSNSVESAMTLAELAKLVGEARGKKVEAKVVSPKDYEDYYIHERKMDPAAVKWWATTYDALPAGECLIEDSPLPELLRSKNRTPKSMQQTIKEMTSA